MTMEQKCKDLITENYDQILNQIRVLWKKKFEKLFIPLNVTYDDFEGQALLEISLNIPKYDCDKGAKLLTFCSVIINNKMKTYATSLNREKRKINTYAQSLNQSISDESEIELIDLIQSDSPEVESKITNDDYVKYIKDIIQFLPLRKKKIVEYLIKGYNSEEISKQINIPVCIVKGDILTISEDSNIISAIMARRKSEW